MRDDQKKPISEELQKQKDLIRMLNNKNLNKEEMQKIETILKNIK